MSLFATLMRKGRRKNSISHDRGQKLEKDQSESSIFKSTPNLHEVGNDSGNTAAEETLDGAVTYYDYEKNPRSPFRIFQGQTMDSLSPVRPNNGSNTSLSSSLSVASQDSRLSTPASKKSLSSLRGFVSMVSMASGVKKTKSIRRKAFASATHLRTSDHSTLIKSEDQVDEGVIQEDTPVFNENIINRTPSMKSSKSVPNMETDSDRGHSRSMSEKYNSEPGVESSSTSLSSACTNQSENELYSPVLRSTLDRALTESSFGEDSGSIASQEDPSIEKRKLMLQGAKKFNMDPKKGIDFLVLNGLFERTPESIAQFLKHGEQLSKTAIGNYLGEHHAFNLEVLSAFVELHDFTDVLLVEALRQFLWSFRLPGEAQKIDRMMESFAKRYTHCNPLLFANSDTCYLLSFAIIMLNTSLHNPNVKEKPTLEQFIQMNRDIDDGQPLDRKFITSLYQSIQSEPFKIPPEDGNDLMLTFFNPAMEGWLYKQSGRYKTWKRRWFILSNNCLYYFIYTTDKDPRGIIPLENILVRRSILLGKDYCFTLYKKTTDNNVFDYIKSCKASDGKLTAGKHIRYHLATKDKEDRERWIAAISQNSSYHNFYTILAQKKNKLENMDRNTLKKNRNTQVQPPLQSPVSTPSPSTVRKSQIGLPLSRSDSGMAKSTPHLSNLLTPDSRRLRKNPQKHYPIIGGSSTSIIHNCSGESDDYFLQDSDSGSHVSFETSDSESLRHFSETESHPHINYSTFSLPRAKSRKKHTQPQQHYPPVRKFSLPPDILPNSLLSKVEYLTSPGIRISVEDTTTGKNGEKIVLDENKTIEDGSIENVSHSAPETIQEELSSTSKPENESSIPSESRCSNTFMEALKDFASVMGNLSLSVEGDDDGWTEESADALSMEEQRTTGLTRQCLRSSFKSKRSRFRQKPRKHFHSEGRTSAVFESSEVEKIGPITDDVPEDPPHSTYPSSVLSSGESNNDENPLPVPRMELHSEV